MKKNFLFKGVSILGAVMLLTNTMLPGLQVFADSEGLSAPTIEKIDITGWQEGDAEGIKTNHSKFDFDFEDDTLTIYDNGLESYKGGETDSHKYVGLLVDFGTTVKGKTNYNIEDGDKTDADRWGGNTESETDFVMRLSETKNGKTLTFEDLTDSSKTRDIKVVFKEIDADSVSFDKLTIPENATDTYIENITTNNSKFDFNYDSETNELSIMDNGLINYDNGHGENKWIGILADFGAIVEGVADIE